MEPMFAAAASLNALFDVALLTLCNLPFLGRTFCVFSYGGLLKRLYDYGDS